VCISDVPKQPICMKRAYRGFSMGTYSSHFARAGAHGMHVTLPHAFRGCCYLHTRSVGGSALSLYLVEM
jgi:hypothetical protein